MTAFGTSISYRRFASTKMWYCTKKAK